MKFRNDIKKNSISGESSKPGKLSQQGKPEYLEEES